MITLNDQNFEEKVLKSAQPVVVDFWSPYCFPCLVLAPIFEKLEKEFQDKAIFAKANLDEVPSIAQKYRIEQIPTVLLFKEGKIVSGFVGFWPKEIIQKWLQKFLL
jgi:thioredoxin 1